MPSSTSTQTGTLTAATGGQAYNFTANNVVGLTIADQTSTNDTVNAGNGGDILIAGTGNET